jgi:hypothetical protein
MKNVNFEINVSTIVLVLAIERIMGVISLSWWIIFSPFILVAGLLGLLLLCGLVAIIVSEVRGEVNRPCYYVLKTIRDLCNVMDKTKKDEQTDTK